jgi:hypothetical protein
MLWRRDFEKEDPSPLLDLGELVHYIRKRFVRSNISKNWIYT